MSPISSGDSPLLDVIDTVLKSLLLLLLLMLLLVLLLFKIRTAIDSIEAGFIIGSGQQQVA